MSNKATPEQKAEKVRSFILVTREMIETHNFGDIHIRKIAEKAGFHNSTIYSYFKDADYLIALSSVKFFEKYSKALSELSTKDLSEEESFFEIWKLFCLNAFESPAIYNHFFLGRHSNDLTKIFNEYYALFPEEKQKHSDKINTMYFGKNLSVRCLEILKPLVNSENTRLTEDNLEIANKIIISVFKNLLATAIQKTGFELSEYSPEALTEEFLTSLKFVVNK